jgi:hypothetical protein
VTLAAGTVSVLDYERATPATERGLTWKPRYACPPLPDTSLLDGRLADTVRSNTMATTATHVDPDALAITTERIAAVAAGRG